VPGKFGGSGDADWIFLSKTAMLSPLGWLVGWLVAEAASRVASLRSEGASVRKCFSHERHFKSE
jgi:hypothetical protein